jgi:hypothetical protein
VGRVGGRRVGGEGGNMVGEKGRREGRKEGVAVRGCPPIFFLSPRKSSTITQRRSQVYHDLYYIV